jgi:hypothetical protein
MSRDQFDQLIAVPVLAGCLIGWCANYRFSQIDTSPPPPAPVVVPEPTPKPAPQPLPEPPPWKPKPPAPL